MPAPRIAAAVCVRDLTKRYGPVEALRGISFDVAAGEIFGLLGPNGAGKTTALECLLGLRRPDAGTLTIGGIDALARPAEVRPLVGAQLQAAALQDKITPLQALELAASFYAEPADARALLAQFGLSDKARAPFDSLSAGQKQRTLLALAFVHRPRLVVLDEPTAGLDPHSRRELHAIVRSLRADGCTILLSTHQLDEAEQCCDRIGILHEGRLIAVAPPAELIARSRALPRLEFRTAQPVAAKVVKALESVVSAEWQEHEWRVSTTDAGRTITALAQSLEREGNTLLDLQTRRPTLEDVFIELTGERWTAPVTAEHAEPPSAEGSAR